MGTNDAGSPNIALIVHDGETLWCHLPESNQYFSFSASELTAPDAGDSTDMTPAAMHPGACKRQPLKFREAAGNFCPDSLNLAKFSPVARSAIRVSQG